VIRKRRKNLALHKTNDLGSLIQYLAKLRVTERERLITRDCAQPQQVLAHGRQAGSGNNMLYYNRLPDV